MATVGQQPRSDHHRMTDFDEEQLGRVAWEVRERARVHGPTRVGAAAITASGQVFVGCNVEHRFRSHDVHAEVNALTSMVAAGAGPAVAVVIAAERERFTPCGSCLDWIFEVGGPSCLVGSQPQQGAPIAWLRADELMPHYPY
jgi:cytidine deaminase